MISQILAEFHVERATYKTLHYFFFFFYGLSKFATKNLLLGFKTCFLLTQSTLLFWGTSPLIIIIQFDIGFNQSGCNSSVKSWSIIIFIYLFAIFFHVKYLKCAYIFHNRSLLSTLYNTG